MTPEPVSAPPSPLVPIGRIVTVIGVVIFAVYLLGVAVSSRPAPHAALIIDSVSICRGQFNHIAGTCREDHRSRGLTVVCRYRGATAGQTNLQAAWYFNGALLETTASAPLNYQNGFFYHHITAGTPGTYKAAVFNDTVTIAAPEVVVADATTTPPEIPQLTGPVLNAIPLEIGAVTTCSSVNAWRNYVPKTEFLPGDRLFIYAEALNVNQAGRIDLAFDYRIVAPDGRAVLQRRMPAFGTGYSSWATWPEFVLPAELVPGVYRAQVEIRNNLTSQSGNASTTFTVLGPQPPPPTPPPEPGKPPAIEPAPPDTEVYSGPMQGVLYWSGDIGAPAEIAIDGDQSNVGTVQGRLPGARCQVEIVSHSRPIAIVEPPAPSNNWSRVVVRMTGRGRQSFSLRWTVLAPVGADR